MGTKYTTTNRTGFDSNPPPDDGSTGDNNKVTWSKHKDKLALPIADQVDAIDTKLVDQADVATSLKASNYPAVADDDGRVISVTGTTTITLGLASSMGAGYGVTVKCISGTTTIALSGIDEIDGSTANRTLTAGKSETYRVNNGGSSYLLINEKFNLLDEDDMASDSATDAASQQSIKAYIANMVVISAAQTTYTAGENWTHPHGQSSAPDLVYAFGVCLNANQGFVTGDIVKLPISFDSSIMSGVMPWADDTDLGGFVTANIAQGDDAGVYNKSTGTLGLMGVGDWEIYIKGIWF